MILVVDDEPGITELLTDLLEYHGHPVIIANDARSVLDFLRHCVTIHGRAPFRSSP
jgi:CheY-like chemotaxis protein